MLKTNRRSEFEIVHELLTHAMNGAKKTYLMYQTNLCYSQFNEYLECLLKRKFLELDNGSNGRLYITTEKGRKLLESVEETFTLVR